MAKVSEPKGLGDLVAWAAKEIGLTHCEACEERRKLFNAWVGANPEKARDLIKKFFGRNKI